MPFPGIQTTGGALDFRVNASEGSSSPGEGLRGGAALSEDADGREAFLSHRSLDSGAWAEASGGPFWRGLGEFYSEAVCLLLRPLDTLLPGRATTHPGLPRTRGVPGVQDFRFLNQDSPRQTRTSWSPYSFRADISDQPQCWVWTSKGARR